MEHLTGCVTAQLSGRFYFVRHLIRKLTFTEAETLIWPTESVLLSLASAEAFPLDIFCELFWYIPPLPRAPQ